MQKTDILYVEDDSDFTEIVERAMHQVDGNTRLTIFEDGTSAVRKLNEVAQEKDKPRLILLDMNLPGISGLDILKKIKETQALRCIPVVMFSTSDNPRDIRASLESGANAYVAKPLGYLNLIDCLKSMHSFWIKTASCVS